MDRDSRPYCRLPRHEPSGQGVGLYRPLGTCGMLCSFCTFVYSYPSFVLVLGSTILVLLGKQDRQNVVNAVLGFRAARAGRYLLYS